jgi:hypothetical protein
MEFLRMTRRLETVLFAQTRIPHFEAEVIAIGAVEVRSLPCFAIYTMDHPNP